MILFPESPDYHETKAQGAAYAEMWAALQNVSQAINRAAAHDPVRLLLNHKPDDQPSIAALITPPRVDRPGPVTRYTVDALERLRAAGETASGEIEAALPLLRECSEWVERDSAIWERAELVAATWLFKHRPVPSEPGEFQ